MEFTICEMEEKIEEKGTVLEGRQTFHTINVLAKRN